MYADEVQRTYENEVEPLSLRETRPTVQLIRMAANASPMQAQVGSFIQPQVYSSFLDNVRQVLVANGVMVASAVLTNEIILAKFGYDVDFTLDNLRLTNKQDITYGQLFDRLRPGLNY